MRQRLEDLSLAFKGLGMGNNIQFHEYDFKASICGCQECNDVDIWIIAPSAEDRVPITPAPGTCVKPRAAFNVYGYEIL